MNTVCPSCFFEKENGHAPTCVKQQNENSKTMLKIKPSSLSDLEFHVKVDVSDGSKTPTCEECGYSLVDLTVGNCKCGKYSW